MSLRFKVDQKVLDQEMTRAIRQIKVGTARAAQQAAVVARQRMTTYLIASVYGTAPGFLYERTSAALEQLGMTLTPSGDGDFRLTLSSNAPYASQIELGSELDYFGQQAAGNPGPPRISADELALLLGNVADDTGGDPSPGAFFHRSGVQYQEPGPHVTPAAVAGLYDFIKRLDAVWREAGR